jgi:hypothetical protein
MRISDVLFWGDQALEGSRSAYHHDIPVPRADDDLANLATAFTRRGLVKSFWNLNGSEGQPSEPAPPDAGTEMIPNGTLEPITPSWKAEPVETEPLAGRNRLVPTRQN